MRHYVACVRCNKRIYFATDARTRSDLPDSFPLTCPHCGQKAAYSGYQVTAEEGQLRVGGALLGGLLGLAAGGGAGAIIGALLGGLIGESQEPSEKAAVREFNDSV